MNKDNILKVLMLLQKAKRHDTFLPIGLGFGYQVNATGDVCDSSTPDRIPFPLYNVLTVAGHKANLLGLIAISEVWQMDSGGAVDTNLGYPLFYKDSNGKMVSSRLGGVDLWLGITEYELLDLMRCAHIDSIITALSVMWSSSGEATAEPEKSQFETDLLKMIQDAGSLENKELIRKGVVDSVQYMNVYQFIQSNKEELLELGVNIPNLSCWVSEIEWLEKRLS